MGHCRTITANTWQNQHGCFKIVLFITEFDKYCVWSSKYWRTSHYSHSCLSSSSAHHPELSLSSVLHTNVVHYVLYTINQSVLFWQLQEIIVFYCVTLTGNGLKPWFPMSWQNIQRSLTNPFINTTVYVSKILMSESWILSKKVRILRTQINVSDVALILFHKFAFIIMHSS